MATTSTALSAVTYNFYATMTYILDDESTAIDAMYISSIITDYNFSSNNMPMIFVTLSLNLSLVKKMINNVNSGTIILTLQKFNKNSDMLIKTDIIKDEFAYFITDEVYRYDITSSNTSVGVNTEVSDESSDPIIQSVTVGLLSISNLNNNKKDVNGVANNTDMHSVVYHTLSHYDSIVIEPFTNNSIYSSLIIPPQNSIAKTIKYLNNLCAFYDTAYRFFADLDCVYLLSSSGKAILKKNETIGNVRIAIYADSNTSSAIQGMVTDTATGMYTFNVGTSDVQVSTSLATDLSYSSITAVSTSGTVTTVDVQAGSSSVLNSKTKTVRVSNDNTGIVSVLKSQIESTATTVFINKSGIDPSVITLNKKYTLVFSDDSTYSDLSGDYLLTRRRDMFMISDDTLEGTTMLIFQKIAS